MEALSLATVKRQSEHAAARPSQPLTLRPKPAAASQHNVAPASKTSAPLEGLENLLAYQRDVWERAILFWDALRERADNMLEHERLGLPPLLDFRSETVLDARTFERPANYALLRIVEAESADAEHCIEEGKPPVVIIDPRAGHGPGIGGFKRESEVGMALKEGHPVYFVVFFPEPCRGQTLADVLHALRRFLEAVAARHPGTPPVLYGNCQAGWAVTLLSADCHGLVGPTVLNGSPLSYWAGEAGVNPMRLSAGFLGGAWLAHLISDLGDGRFDGAWLVQNFESLKPEAIWEKYANLFTRIDSERDRFLSFERWWNGFYFLSRHEILAIVENLFIGNQLEQGLFRICEGCTADLRRIRNPLVIFASYGDNITPPHQALGWIPAVYRDTADLKAAGQRIVYLTNPHVGHLGIFVSAGVARFEHRAILESLGELEALEPGLYEMRIDNPTGDPRCHKPHYSVSFEPRQVEDLRFEYPRAAFEQVRAVSETTEAFYRTIVSPWMQALANPWTATAAKWLHPMRTSRYLLSGSFSPWMHGIAAAADAVRRSRHPLPDDNPALIEERALIARTTGVLEDARKRRDAAQEGLFGRLYGAEP
ncbi:MULTISPECIES: DUF3141 domain-containing protein [Hyphomicrobiales]|jgi:hypothetical protein|uniref:DUF3141 domain-containing protein n=1 Tax=Methylobacterium sp. CCH7-A2 TaxID=1768789 RepID=UPI0008362073|nr:MULTISPECIES: DUF3141 domain-containing protein [Hyphomicrobiales]